MAQRPSIKQPKPLTTHAAEPERMPSAAPISSQMLGEMKAEISAEAAPLWNFVMNNARRIALGVVALVLVIASVAGWEWYKEHSASAAQANLGRISAMPDPVARLAALEAFAPSAPSSVFLATQMTLAANAAAQQQWEKAAAAYAEVAKRDAGSALAFVAELNRADILVRLGKPEEAVAAVEALLPKTPPELVPSVQLQIAEAAEAAGNNAKARAAYEAAAAASPEEAPYLKARAAALP